MKTTPLATIPHQPIDVEAVRADDVLVEDLRAGNNPDGRLPALLAAWRDDARDHPTP